MKLDLATIPADLLESSPDHASETPSDPASEPVLETAAKSSGPVPHSPSQKIQEIQGSQKTTANYPNDPFVHALYGGFMGTPDLPGAPLRADIWDTFVGAYTNPDLRDLFTDIAFPTA